MRRCSTWVDLSDGHVWRVEWLQVGRYRFRERLLDLGPAGFEEPDSGEGDGTLPPWLVLLIVFGLATLEMSLGAYWGVW
jgi:hypothetical protein